MRIAIAHDSIDTEGGVEAYLLSIVCELRARGHGVALLHHRRAAATSALRAAADVAIGIEERGLDPALADLRRWSPDVCYSHNMAPLDVDEALIRTWRVVKMLHGFFGTCVSGLKMHAFPSERACTRTLGPACLAFYVPRRCGQLTPGAMLKGYRWAIEQRALFERYTSIVVASEYMRDEVCRHGVPARHIDVLPLFSTIQPVASPMAGEGDTVLFAGRITTLKGGHVLIAAAAHAAKLIGRGIRVLVAGDGPQRDDWRQRAASLGVDAEFTGWVPFGDRTRVYSRGTFLVMPSLWPEPFGLAGLDAAAVGRPAIAFDVGGIRTWLRDGVNGRLVDPDAGEQGLARAIAALLEAPSEREQMGHEALLAARCMCVTAHVDRLEPVLRKAAAAGGGTAAEN
jgi:glycosyltransferase involved in cell wall biosynthesis